MSANVDWDDKYGNVLLMYFEGNPSLDEALDATEKESALIAEATQKVHTIIDLRKATGIPSNFISSMPRIAKMPAASHPNAGLKIVVGASTAISVILTIFSKTYRNLKMVKTLDEAYAILDNDPRTIPPRASTNE